MVFSNGFVVAIIHDGKVCEERKDGIVILPEGSEYTIRLRNKNNRRAVGQIFIDNENVSEGGYIINAYDYVDIHRFAHKDEAFKLVGLNSGEAVDAGKNGPNDGTKGVIEVKFRLEREYSPYQTLIIPRPVKRGGWPEPKLWFTTGDEPNLLSKGGSRSLSSGVEREVKTSGGIQLPPETQTFNSIQDAVTVGGKSTGQRFRATHIELDGPETILRVVLKAGEPVEKLNYCPHCGAKANKRAKFCQNCGNRLTA